MGFFDYPVESESADSSAASAPAYTFLENLPAASWKKILAQAESIHFKPGQIVINAGEHDDAFYILSAGVVDVIIPGKKGNLVLATIPEGSVFGEIAFFDGQPRSATIRARTSGSAIRVSRESFDRLASWEPALARTMLFDLGKVLAVRLRWTTKHVKGVVAHH